MKLTFPFVSPELIIGQNVIIVGSSGGLMNSTLGRAIDSYDEVIRFNRARTDGFEESVGCKTTLRVANNHVFDNLDISSRGYSDQPQHFVKALRNQRILYCGPVIGPWDRREQNAHASNQLHLFDYDKIADLKSQLEMNFVDLPTVGGVTIGLCVLAGTVPTIAGFDLVPMNRTHYWETRPSEAGPLHNVSEEQKWILSLVANGRVRILTRNCFSFGHHFRRYRWRVVKWIQSKRAVLALWLNKP